jgi:hypothetical protein
MTVVHKFLLQTRGVQVLTMPKGAKFLSVANQQEDLCLWAEVPDEEPPSSDAAPIGLGLEARTIAIYGTGHSFPDDINQQFLGTVLLRQGHLVVHIYEVK